MKTAAFAFAAFIAVGAAPAAAPATAGALPPLADGQSLSNDLVEPVQYYYRPYRRRYYRPFYYHPRYYYRPPYYRPYRYYY